MSRRTIRASSPVPALFCAHGSPMNLIGESPFSHALTRLGRTLARPQAILVISAHWTTVGRYVTTSAAPTTLYDFYGFPERLYRLTYPATGNPELAHRLCADLQATGDERRGLDHGAWSILRHLFPDADIPVIQLSLDMSLSATRHWALGTRLQRYRDEGVMIIGSGNIVHNLERLDPDPLQHATPWAGMFAEAIKTALCRRDTTRLIHPEELSDAARLACPTPEHYRPMLYIAALRRPGEPLTFAYEGFEHGTISLASFVVGGAS